MPATLLIKALNIVENMQTNQIPKVGIDISKDTFDFYSINDSGKVLKGKLSNDVAGFSDLLLLLSAESHVVMEASGPYYYPLACFLHEQGVVVSVVNPLVIRRFCQMAMQRAKTDASDAQSIYQYACMVTLKAWKPLQKHYLQLKQWYAVRKQFVRQQHATARQLEAFQATGQIEKELESYLEKELAAIHTKLRQVDEQLEALIQEENSTLKEQLESIPGIGSRSSLLLILCLRGFQDFDNYKQVICYLGLAPRIYQSGTSVKGKSKICKLGTSDVRHCLYMAARSARKYNPACKLLYDRLRAKGKAHRQAMIAVVNKLLKQAFAIAKSGQRFDPNYQALAN